jgi:hypothetical protein
VKFRLYGPDTVLTEAAQEIVAEDLAALSARVASGWDINAKFQVCEHISELPIALALVENKLRVVDWLLGLDVDLNVEGEPAIVWASRNCEPAVLESLVAHGALLDRFDLVGKSAYSGALYSERLDLLPVLSRLGLPIDVDRGTSLRQAAFGGQFDAVRFFVENGLDPDLHVPDSVFPFNPTAVAIAAQEGHLEMVKYLVEHGADVSLQDELGDRPYSLAAANQHESLMNYLRALEDPRLHAVEDRVAALRPYRLPSDLIDFLRGESRRIELEGEGPRFLQFHDVLGVKEMKWEGRKIIDLLASADDYWEKGFLVWSPAEKKLAHADLEHGRFLVLCSWHEFTGSPRKWVDSIFS